MSFRTWVYVFALIGLAAAAYAGKLSWDHFSAYQKNHANERIRASEYYSETTQEGPTSCGSIVGENGFSAWFGCIVESITADGSVKQAEYDLKAQQDMAAWAFGMLLATVWIAIITLLGVVFVGWTLFATRKMATDTREIGEAQIRAYVSIDEITISNLPDRKGRFEAEVILKNTGQSPAWKVHNEIQVAFATTKQLVQLRGNTLPLPPVEAQAGSPKTEIAAGGTFRGKAHTPIGVLDESSPGLIDSGHAVLFARGWVTYEDVFGKPHRTDYAWHRDKETNDAGFSITASTKGNSST